MAKKTRGGESVRQHAQENSAIELDDIQLQNAQTEGQSTKGQSTKGQSAKGQSTEGQRSEKAPRRIELFTYCAESLKELRETYGLEGVTYGDKITKGAEIEGLIKYLNDNGFDNIESICSYNGMVAAAYILCRWIRPSELRLIAEKLKVNNFKVYKGTVELSFKNDSERARFVGRLGIQSDVRLVVQRRIESVRLQQGSGQCGVEWGETTTEVRTQNIGVDRQRQLGRSPLHRS